ncbi:hypothetical protein Tco_0196559 [Tanacetum coccineum]
MKTLMYSDTKLTKDEECESVDSTKYRGMIGNLLYLTESRPDIMFSVCLCASFQEAPKTSHLEAVKRIFRYIKVTTHLGLWYPKGTGIETIVYGDSNHVEDYVDRKSTSGECSYSEEPSLDSLKINQELNTPYQTHIPTPKKIIQSITTTRQTVFPNIILKEELRHDMRSWNEIIQDNAFGTQNDSAFLPASSSHDVRILTSTSASTLLLSNQTS